MHPLILMKWRSARPSSCRRSGHSAYLPSSCLFATVPTPHPRWPPLQIALAVRSQGRYYRATDTAIELVVLLSKNRDSVVVRRGCTPVFAVFLRSSLPLPWPDRPQRWASGAGSSFMSWAEAWLVRHDRAPVQRGADDGVSMRLFKRSTYATSYYGGGFRDENVLPNVRRLASGAEEPFFDTFDPDDDPLSVIGRRVAVSTFVSSYTVGRTVYGTVEQWNATTREHLGALF